MGFELGGNIALFQGDYKLLLNRGPIGDDQWRLFNIQVDPTEQNDLAAALPGRFDSMKQAYAAYAKEHGVLEVPDGYDQRMQVGRNLMSSRIDAAMPLLGLLVVIVVMVVGWRRIRA